MSSQACLWRGVLTREVVPIWMPAWRSTGISRMCTPVCLTSSAARGTYRAGRFRPQEPVVDIDPAVAYAATVGRIVVHRAYGNWQYFGRYRDELQAHAVDLVQLSR